MSQLHKVIFILMNFPRRAIWGNFLKIFAYHYLYMFLYFSRTIQLLQINFFADVLNITIWVTSLKNSFTASPSAGNNFLVFCGYFLRMFLYFFSYALSYHINFLQILFVLPWLSNWWEKFQSMYLCSEGYFTVFLSIFFHVLRNFSPNLDIIWSSLNCKMWWVSLYFIQYPLSNILGCFGTINYCLLQ